MDVARAMSERTEGPETAGRAAIRHILAVASMKVIGVLTNHRISGRWQSKFGSCHS